MKKAKKLISKKALISKISKKANISSAKAKTAYECVLKENPAFREQEVKTVKVSTQVPVKVAGKTVVKKVNLTKQKAVKALVTKEKIKPVKVKKEVPVTKTVTKEKIKVVEIIKEVPVTLVKEIEVIKEVQVMKEVPVEVIKEVEIIKEVEVIKEVPVQIIKEVIKEVQVIKEVPIERIKEITLVNEVEVIKEIEIIKQVPDLKAIKALEKKYAALERTYYAMEKKYKETSKKLAAKPKVIVKEIIKEVPVEIIKEIEVVKSIDFDSLKKMMSNMGTVEVSKKVVGETRTVKDAKVVSRREIEGETKVKAKKAKATKVKSKKDDLKKVEGIGPKIEKLLNADKISTFAKLSKTDVKTLKSILTKAGSRFQMHDPSTWPKQSLMASKGQWEKLKKWQDELQGGRN